jgi:hypothetical protein
MEIPVLIEPVPGVGYRASGGEPFAIVAEGSTAEEALSQFKERVSAKLQNGTHVTSVQIPSNDHPWLEFSGMYDPDDPLVQEWLAIMKEDRERDEVE